MRNLFLFIAAVIFISACNPLGSDGAKNDTTPTQTASGETINEVRSNPKSSPVASYERKVKDDLNTWFFRVQLYETKQRFVYRMMMQYEEIKEEKEITFPNLNEEPKPEVRTGSKEYDAIVGFIDNKGNFKEYLNVFVQDNNLQLKTLKHYAVSVQ